MSIPQAAIDDILARVDIVDVIRPRVALKRAGREWQACCPFHNEKTPSFTVSPKKQFYYCFGCHASGNALKFLMEFEHLPFREAMESLASLAGVPLPDDRPQDTAALQARAEERDALEQASQYFRQRLPASAAAQYLEQRGINAAMIETFGIGYAPEQPSLPAALPPAAGERAGLLFRRDDGTTFPRFRHRLMFPIRDPRGRVVGFGGRTLGDDKAKYLNSPETPLFHKGRLLYGLYEARQARRELPGLLVVEGYLDVISLAQFGIDYAVATLGTAATPEHVEQLLRVDPRLTFCFDGDKAGRRAAAHALDVVLPQLRDGHQVRFLFLEEGHDPDTLVRDIGADAFAERIASAQPLTAYLLDRLASGLDLGSIEGRAAMAERAREALTHLRAPALRAGLEAELQKRTGLTPGSNSTPRAAAVERSAPRHGMRQAVAPPARTPFSQAHRALVLLLTWPNLAELAEDIETLAEHPDPDAELLARVIDTLHAEPQLHCGALLHRFEHDAQSALLQRLAAVDVELDSTAAQAEFLHVLQSLQDVDPRDRLQALSERAGSGTLTTDEQAELITLLGELARLSDST